MRVLGVLNRSLSLDVEASNLLQHAHRVQPMSASRVRTLTTQMRVGITTTAAVGALRSNVGSTPAPPRTQEILTVTTRLTRTHVPEATYLLCLRCRQLTQITCHPAVTTALPGARHLNQNSTILARTIITTTATAETITTPTVAIK